MASWVKPDQRTLNAWANDIDATEFGAYGVSLAAVEVAKGLLAFSRTRTLTVADYYLAPAGTAPDDLENCLRLEVSGVDAGDAARPWCYRLSIALKYAGAVSFR